MNQFFLKVSFSQKFAQATVAEVMKLIAKSPCNSCDHKPLPTWLLKQCSPQLLPLLTAIINQSPKVIQKSGIIPPREPPTRVWSP